MNKKTAIDNHVDLLKSENVKYDLQDLGMQGGFTQIGKTPKIRTHIQNNLIEALKTGTNEPVEFGQLSPKLKQQVNILLIQAGQNPISNNNVKIYPNVITKLQNGRIAEGLSPETISDIAYSVIHGRPKVLPGKYPQTIKLLKIKKNRQTINKGIIAGFDNNVSLKNVLLDDLPKGGGGKFPPSSLTSEIQNAPQPAKISVTQGTAQSLPQSPQKVNLPQKLTEKS